MVLKLRLFSTNYSRAPPKRFLSYKTTEDLAGRGAEVRLGAAGLARNLVNTN